MVRRMGRYKRWDLDTIDEIGRARFDHVVIQALMILREDRRSGCRNIAGNKSKIERTGFL